MSAFDQDPRPEHDPTQGVSFYFAAHQDDWQLFMNPSAFKDVTGGLKSVFVHMTAGDAGLGTKKYDTIHPLYLARENGAEAAMSFMADSDNRTPVERSISTARFNGRPIRRVSYRNTVGYFLRLPDGSPEGVGYSETGYQSLKLLSESQIRKLTAIDETASYYDWDDLTETIRSIIEFERGDAVIQLHIPDLDPVLNPNDHSDHYMTAKAALNAAEGLSAAARVHHVGYASAGLPENLGGQSRDMKCATYAVTLAGVLAMGHPVSWGHYDQLFIGRNYFRVDDSGPK